MSFETNKSKKKHDETCLPSWTIRIKIWTGLWLMMVSDSNKHSETRIRSVILVPHQQISTTRTLNRWVEYSHSNFQRNPRSGWQRHLFPTLWKFWVDKSSPNLGSCVSRCSPDINRRQQKNEGLSKSAQLRPLLLWLWYAQEFRACWKPTAVLCPWFTGYGSDERDSMISEYPTYWVKYRVVIC